MHSGLHRQSSMAPRGVAIGVASGRCPVIQDGLSSIGQEALIHRAELVSDGPRPRNDSARHGPTRSPTSTRKTFATPLLAPADPHRHHHGAVGQPLWTMPRAPRSSTGTLSKPIASGWNKWRTSSVTQANPAAANAPSDHRSGKVRCQKHDSAGEPPGCIPHCGAPARDRPAGDIPAGPRPEPSPILRTTKSARPERARCSDEIGTGRRGATVQMGSVRAS
jgi:hypothetical protein